MQHTYIIVGIALVGVYAKWGIIDKALKSFDNVDMVLGQFGDITQRNVVSWQAKIVEYAQINLLKLRSL